MTKVPAVGDVQKMITVASAGAAVFYVGVAASLALLALNFMKPGVAGNPIGGAIFGIVLLALAVYCQMQHNSSPRRKRTIMSLLQKADGKTYMKVRYMDGKTETVLADGEH
jgi:hypothetical protein